MVPSPVSPVFGVGRSRNKETVKQRDGHRNGHPERNLAERNLAERNLAGLRAARSRRLESKSNYGWFYAPPCRSAAFRSSSRVFSTIMYS